MRKYREKLLELDQNYNDEEYKIDLAAYKQKIALQEDIFREQQDRWKKFYFEQLHLLRTNLYSQAELQSRLHEMLTVNENETRSEVLIDNARSYYHNRQRVEEDGIKDLIQTIKENEAALEKAKIEAQRTQADYTEGADSGVIGDQLKELEQAAKTASDNVETLSLTIQNNLTELSNAQTRHLINTVEYLKAVHEAYFQASEELNNQQTEEANRRNQIRENK